MYKPMYTYYTYAGVGGKIRNKKQRLNAKPIQQQHPVYLLLGPHKKRERPRSRFSSNWVVVQGSGLRVRVGMFPLRLTVLSRDSSTPSYAPY